MPNATDVKDDDLSVNITEKWDRLEKEIVATGICEGLLLFENAALPDSCKN